MKRINWNFIGALIFVIIFVIIFLFIYSDARNDLNKLNEAYSLNSKSYIHWSKETETLYQPEKEACEKFFNGEFSVELEKRNNSSRYYRPLSYIPFCTIVEGDFIRRFRMVKFKDDWKLTE